MAGLQSLGVLQTGAFRSGAGVTGGTDADDRIIFNTTSKKIFYDADGSGGVAAVEIGAVGSGVTLSYSDFIVI